MQTMKRLAFELSCIGAAALGALAFGTEPSWAIVMSAPAPVIGVTGPYGILVAGVVYGGYLLVRRFQNR